MDDKRYGEGSSSQRTSGPKKSRKTPKPSLRYFLFSHRMDEFFRGTWIILSMQFVHMLLHPVFAVDVMLSVPSKFGEWVYLDILYELPKVKVTRSKNVILSHHKYLTSVRRSCRSK